MSFFDLFSASPVKKPSLIGSLKVGKFMTSYPLAAMKNYVFMCSNNSLLITVDVSNPSMPTIVNEHKIRYDGQSISLSNGYAFIATPIGLLVYDIKDPKNPVFVAENTEIKSLYPISASENYLYAIGNSINLHIFDYTDMHSPKLMGLGRLKNCASAIIVINSRAYTVDIEGIEVIDVENPSIIRTVSTVSIPEGAWSITGNKDIIITTGRKLFSRVFDISEIKPREVCSFVQGGNSYSMSLVDNLLYIYLSSFGLQIYDMNGLY